jgi:nitroimidazol reductase NimA-like FMN-containing flavoprotein (pyridoxamine 5'-phosphate oxidase superfamily)
MRQLTDAEVIDVLQRNGTGVLALNDWVDANPHPLPVSYGYDDERDLFVVQLEGDEESHKKRCLQRDRNVGFTVYEETDPKSTWRSVIVKGELVETEHADVEPALAALATNTQYAPNPVTWGDSDTVSPYQLEIETWSGREFTIG